MVRSDFFEWFGRDRFSTFDGVAGNPPYIRFGSWEEAHRARAFALMRHEGLNPTRLTNAWVPFVVAALLAVRTGGHVGLVLPAELLQVGYAAPLRSHLVDHCSQVTVISFKHLVFPGVLQEVVLLLAVKGAGPAAIRTVEVADANGLASVDLTGSAVRAHLHESEKWTKYYLGAEAIELVRAARADHRLAPLSSYASVNVGVVTGRNSFFCLTDAEANERRLTRFTVPLVARSAQLTGTEFNVADLAAQGKLDAKTRLLALPPEFDLTKNVAAARYVALGEGEGVQEGYKCRIRKSWWSVPSIYVPDGFMLRQVSTHLRLAANAAGATSTDTVHRLFMRDGVRVDQLATAAFNSVSLAMSEVIGRSYGGGILELEPSECMDLPVPDPALVPEGLVPKVDELIRAKRYDDAMELVDEQVLVEAAGLDPDDVAAMRDVWLRLRNRRAARATRSAT